MESLKRSDRDLSNQISIKTPLTGATTWRRNQSQDRVNQHIGIHKQAAFTSGNYGVVSEAGPGGVTFSEISSSKSLAKGLRLNPRHVPTDVPVDLSDYLQDTSVWEAMEIRFLDKGKCTVLRPNLSSLVSSADVSETTNSTLKSADHASVVYPGAHLLDSPLPIRRQKVCVEKVHVKNLLNTKREKCGNLSSSRLSEYMPLNADVAKEMFEDVEANIRNAKSSSSDLTDSESFESALASNNDDAFVEANRKGMKRDSLETKAEQEYRKGVTQTEIDRLHIIPSKVNNTEKRNVDIELSNDHSRMSKFSQAHSPSIINQSQKSKSNEPVSNQGNSYDQYSCNEDNFKHDRSVMHSNPPTTLRQKMSKMNVSGFSNADTNGEPLGVSVGNHSNQMHWSKVTNPLLSNGESCSEIVYNKTGPSDAHGVSWRRFTGSDKDSEAFLSNVSTEAWIKHCTRCGVKENDTADTSKSRRGTTKRTKCDDTFRSEDLDTTETCDQLTLSSTFKSKAGTYGEALSYDSTNERTSIEATTLKPQDKAVQSDSIIVAKSSVSTFSPLSGAEIAKYKEIALEILMKRKKNQGNSTDTKSGCDSSVTSIQRKKRVHSLTGKKNAKSEKTKPKASVAKTAVKPVNSRSSSTGRLPLPETVNDRSIFWASQRIRNQIDKHKERIAQKNKKKKHDFNDMKMSPAQKKVVTKVGGNQINTEEDEAREKKTLQKNAPSEISFTVSSAQVDTKNLGKKKSESPLPEKKILVKEKSFMALKMVPTTETPSTKCDRPLTNVESHEIKYAFADQSEGGRSISHTTDERFLNPGTKTLVGETQTESSLANSRGEYKSVATGPVASDLMYLDVLDFKDDMLSQSRKLPLQALNSTQTETACKLHKTFGSSGIQVQPHSLSQVPQSPANERPRHSSQQIRYLELLQNILKSPTSQTTQALGMFLHKPKALAEAERDLDITVDQIINSYQEIFNDLKGAVPNRSYDNLNQRFSSQKGFGYVNSIYENDLSPTPHPTCSSLSCHSKRVITNRDNTPIEKHCDSTKINCNNPTETNVNMKVASCDSVHYKCRFRKDSLQNSRVPMQESNSCKPTPAKKVYNARLSSSAFFESEKMSTAPCSQRQQRGCSYTLSSCSSKHKQVESGNCNTFGYTKSQSSTLMLGKNTNLNTPTSDKPIAVSSQHSSRGDLLEKYVLDFLQKNQSSPRQLATKSKTSCVQLPSNTGSRSSLVSKKGNVDFCPRYQRDVAKSTHEKENNQLELLLHSFQQNVLSGEPETLDMQQTRPAITIIAPQACVNISSTPVPDIQSMSSNDCDRPCLQKKTFTDSHLQQNAEARRNLDNITQQKSASGSVMVTKTRRIRPLPVGVKRDNKPKEMLNKSPSEIDKKGQLQNQVKISNSLTIPRRKQAGTVDAVISSTSQNKGAYGKQRQCLFSVFRPPPVNQMTSRHEIVPAPSTQSADPKLETPKTTQKRINLRKSSSVDSAFTKWNKNSLALPIQENREDLLKSESRSLVGSVSSEIRTVEDVLSVKSIQSGATDFNNKSNVVRTSKMGISQNKFFPIGQVRKQTFQRNEVAEKLVSMQSKSQRTIANAATRPSKASSLTQSATVAMKSISASSVNSEKALQSPRRASKNQILGTRRKLSRDPNPLRSSSNSAGKVRHPPNVIHNKNVIGSNHKETSNVTLTQKSNSLLETTNSKRNEDIQPSLNSFGKLQQADFLNESSFATLPLENKLSLLENTEISQECLKAESAKCNSTLSTQNNMASKTLNEALENVEKMQISLEMAERSLRLLEPPISSAQGTTKNSVLPISSMTNKQKPQEPLIPNTRLAETLRKDHRRKVYPLGTSVDGMNTINVTERLNNQLIMSWKPSNSEEDSESEGLSLQAMRRHAVASTCERIIREAKTSDKLNTDITNEALVNCKLNAYPKPLENCFPTKVANKIWPSEILNRPNWLMSSLRTDIEHNAGTKSTMSQDTLNLLAPINAETREEDEESAEFLKSVSSFKVFGKTQIFKDSLPKSLNKYNESEGAVELRISALKTIPSEDINKLKETTSVHDPLLQSQKKTFNSPEENIGIQEIKEPEKLETQRVQSDGVGEKCGEISRENPVLPSLENNMLHASGIMAGAEVLESLEVKSEKVAPRGSSEITNLNIEAVWDTSISNLNEQSLSEKICKDIKPKELKSDDTFMCISAQLRSSDIGSDDPIVQKTTCSLIVENTHEKKSPSSAVVTDAGTQKEEREMLPRITEVLSSNENPLPSYREDVAHDQKAIKNDAAESLTKACQCPPSPTPEQTTGDHSCGVVLKPLESLEQKLEKTVKESMSSCEQQLEAGLRFSATLDTVLLERRSSSENVSISMRGYSHTDICKYSQGMSRGFCSEENDLRFCDISPEALQALTAITTPTVTLPSDTAHVVLRSVSEDPLNDVLSNSNVETLTTMNIDLKLAHHSADARDEAIQVINENLGRSADVTNTKCPSKETKPEDEQVCQQREVLTVTSSTVEKHGSSASSAVVDKEIKGKLSSDQDLSDLNVIGGNAPASRSVSESRDGCNDSKSMTRSVPTKSVHDSQPFVCQHCLQCTGRPPEGTRLPSQEVKMKIRIEFCEDDTFTRAAKHDQHCLCFPVLSSPEKKSAKELTFHLGTNPRHLVRKTHTTFDQYSAEMPRTDCYQWAKKGSESNIFSLPEFSPSMMKSKESYKSHECRWEKRDRRVSTPYTLSCDHLTNDETHDLDTIGYDRDSPSFKVDSFRGSITSLERWDRLNVFQASESTDTYPSTSRSTTDVHSFHLRNEPTTTNISLRTCKNRKTMKKRKYCNAQTQVLCSEMKHSGKMKLNGDNTEQRSAEEDAISSRSILGTPALENITGAAEYDDLTSVRSGNKSVSKLACLPRNAIEKLTTLDTADISSLKETCIASKDIDIPKVLPEHSAANYTVTEQNKVNESSTTVRILSRKKKINENLIQQKAAENLEMFINSVKELKKCEKHSSPPFKPNSGLLRSMQTCIHTSAPENLEKFSRVSISGKFQDSSSSSMMDKFCPTCQFRSVPWLPCDQLEPNVMEELSLSFSEKMFDAKKIHSNLCDTIGHKVIYRPSSTLQKGAAISASPMKLNYLKRLQVTSKKESEFVKSLVFQSSARAHSDASVNTMLSINPVRPFEMETTSDSENTETVLSYLYSTSPRQQTMVNPYRLPENKDFYTQVHSASSGLNDCRKTEVPAHSRRLINQSRAQRDIFIDSLNVIHRINAGYCDTESEIRKQRTFTQRNPFVCTNPFYSNSFESTLAERIDEYISLYSTPRETRLHSSGVDDHACFRSLEDRALVGLRDDYLQTIKNEFDPLKETRQCAFTAEELVAFFGLEDENKVESLSHSAGDIFGTFSHSQPKDKRCCLAQSQNGGSSKKSRDSYEINEFRRKDLSPGANKKKEQVNWDQFQSAPHESSDTLLLDLTCEVSCMSKRQKGCREFEKRHCNGAKFDSVYSDTNDQYLTVPSDQTACNAADREEPNYNKATAIDLKNKVETRSHDFGSTWGKSVPSPKLIRSPSEMSLEASRLSPCLEEYYSYSPFLCACSETPLLHSGTETYDIRKHWASTSVNSSITDTSGSPSVCSDDITSGSAGLTSKSAIKMDIMDSIGILTSHLMTTYIMVKDKMKRRQIKSSKTKLKRLDNQGRNFLNPYNKISSVKENRSKKFVFKKRHQANTTKKHFSTKRARFSSHVYKQLLKQTRSSSDTSSKESVDYTSSNNSEKTCDYLPTGELVSMLTVNYQEPPSNLEVTESKAYHLGSTINNHTPISPELSNETLSRMEKDMVDKETTGMLSLGQCLSQDDNKNSKVVCLIDENRFGNEPKNYSEAMLTEDGGIHVVVNSTEEAHADLKNEFESTESINNDTESRLERQPRFDFSDYHADKCFNQEITRFKGVKLPEDAEASKFIKFKLPKSYVEANTVRDLKLSDDVETNQFKDLKLSDYVEANQFKDLKLSDYVKANQLKDLKLSDYVEANQFKDLKLSDYVEANQFKDLKLSDYVEANQFKDLKLAEDVEANQFKDLKLAEDVEANQFKDLKLSDDIEANTFIELKLSEVAEGTKFKDLKLLEDVETNRCIDLKLCEDEVPASEGEDLYDKLITELQSKSKELIEKDDSMSQYKLRSRPELIRNSVESSNLEATNTFEVKLLGEATTVVDNVEELQSESTDDFEFAEFIDTNAESSFEKQQNYVFCGNPYNQSVRSMPCLQTFLVLLGGTDVFSFSQQPDFSDVKDTGCDTHDLATADYDASLVEERDSTEDIPEIQTKGYRALLLENMCQKLLLESASENDSQEEFVEPVSECDFPDQTQDIVYQTKMFEQDYDGGIHEVVFLTKDVAGESADPDFQSPNVWCKDSGWSLEGRDNPEKMNSTEANLLFGRHNLLQEDDKDLSSSHSTRILRKRLKRERRSFSCSKRRCDSRCWSKQGFSSQETGRQYFKCLQDNRCSSRRSFKPFISRRMCLNRILGTDNRDVQCSPQLRYDSPEIVTTDWKHMPQASLDDKIESFKTQQAETAINLFNRTYSCQGHEEWLHFRNAPLDSTPLSDILTEFDEKCASPDCLERKTEARTESPYIFDDYELDTYEELRSLFTELHGSSSSSSSLMLEAEDTQDSSLYHCGQTLSISSTTLEERESRLGSSHSEKERENCNTWCATQTLLTVHQYISDLTSTSSIFIDPELINPIVSDECVNEEAASIKEHKYNNTKAVQTECSEAESVVSVTKSDYSSNTHFRTILHKCLQTNSFLSYVSKVVDEKLAQKLTEARTQGTPNENISPKLPKPMPRTALSLQGCKWHTPQLPNNEKADQDKKERNSIDETKSETKLGVDKLKFTNSYDVSPTSETRQTFVVDADKISHADELADLSDVCKIAASKLVTENKISLRRLYRGRETFVTKKVLSESEGHPISSSSLLIMWSDSSEQPTIEDEHLDTEEMTPTSISCLRSGRRLFCSPGSPPLQSTKNHVTAKEAILCDKACSAVNITDFSSTSHKRAVHLSPPTTRVKNMQNDPLRLYSSDPVLKVFSQRESAAKSNVSSTNIVKNSDSTGTVTSGDYGRLKNILSAETKMLWKSLTRLEKNSEKCQVCRLQYHMMLSNSSDRMDFLKLDDDEMDHVYHYHGFVSQENEKPDDTNPTPEMLFETQEVKPIFQTAQSNDMHDQNFESERRTSEYDVAKSKNKNEIILNDTYQNLFQKMNHESHVSKLSRLFDRIDENGHNVSDELCPCNAKATSLVAKDNKELKIDSLNNANTIHELKKKSTRVRDDEDPNSTLNHTVKHVFQLSSSESAYSSKCHESADFKQKPTKVCLSRSEMCHNLHDSSQPQERRATSDIQIVPHTQVEDKIDEPNLRKDEVLSDDIQSNSLSDRDGADSVKFRVSDHSDSTLNKQLLDSIIDAHDNVPDNSEPETINTKPKSSKILDANVIDTNVNDLKLSSRFAAPKLAECTSCDAATSTTSRHNNCPPINSSKAPQSLRKQSQHYTKHTSSDTADYWIERLMNILHEMHETFPNTGTTSSLPANFCRSSPQPPYTKTLSTDQGTFSSSERVLPAKNDEKMDNLSDETSTHSNLKMKHVSTVRETKELIASLCKDDTTLLGKSSLELNTSLLEATLSNCHTHEIQSSSADNAPCFLDGAQSSSSHNLAREQTGETSNCLLPNHRCAHKDPSDVEHRSSCTKLDLSIKVNESVKKRDKVKKQVESTVYQCTTKSAERWDSSPKLFKANTAQQECFSLTESCSFKKTSAPDSDSRVNESLWALSEPLDMHHLTSVATVTSDCPVWDQIRFSVNHEQQKPLSSKENTFSKSPFKLSGNPVKVIFASPSVLYKKCMLRKSKSLIELGHISYLNKSFNAPHCIATDASRPENTSSVQPVGCKQNFQSFMPRKAESEINHPRLTSALSSTETVNTSMKSLKHEDKILTTLVQQDHNEKYVAIKLDNSLPLKSKTLTKKTFSNVPSPQSYTPVIKSESYITNAISRTRASPKYSKSLDPVVKCSGLSRETPKRYCDSQEVLAYVRAKAKKVEELNELEHKATFGSEISRDDLKHIGMNQSETVAICLNPVKDVSSSVEKPSQNCQDKETNNDSLGTEGRYYDSTGSKGERKNNDSPVTERKNNDSPVTEGKKNDSPVTEGKNNDSPGNEGKNNDLPGTEGKSYDSPSTEVKRDDVSLREKNCNQKRNSNFEIDTALSNKDREKGPAIPLKEAVVGPCPTLGVTVNKERDKCIVSVDCSSRLNFAELNETDIKTGAQPDSSTTEPGLDRNPEDLEILERDCCTRYCSTSVNDFEHYTKSLNQRVSKMTADRKVNDLSADVAEDISQRFSDIYVRINTSKVILDTVDQHLPNNISEDNANQGILCDNVIPKISDNFMEDKMSHVFSDSVLGVDNSKAVVDTVDQYISNDISGDNGNHGIPCDNIAPNISDSLNGETISQVFSDGILGVDTCKVVFGMVNQQISNNISGENANQGIPCDSLGPNSSGNVNGDKMRQDFSDSIPGVETSKIIFDTVSGLITDQTISNNISVFDANQGIPYDNIVLKDPANVNGDTINKVFSDHVHAVDAHRDIFRINEMVTSNVFSKTAQNVIDKYLIASSKSYGSKNIAEETQQVCFDYNPTAKLFNYRNEKCPWKVLMCEDSETDKTPVVISRKKESDDSCPLKSYQIKLQLNSPIEVEQLNAADDMSSKIKLGTHFKMYQIKSPVNSSPMEVGGQINEAEEISFKNKPDLDLGTRFKSYQLKSQLNSSPMEVGRQLNAADEISCKNKLDIRLCRQEESNDRNEKSVAEIDNGPSLNKFNQIETKSYRVHIDSSRVKSGEEDNLVNKCTISSCDEGIGNNFFIRNDKNVKLNSLSKKSDTFSNDRYSEEKEKTPTNSQLKQSDVSLKTSLNTELNTMTISNFTSKPAAVARSPDFKMTCLSGVPAKSAQLFQKLSISPTTPVPDLNVIKSQLKPVSALTGSHAISGSCTGANDENGLTGKRNSPVYSSDARTETTSLKTDESTIKNKNHTIGRYLNCEIREVLSDACSLHNKPDRCDLTSPSIKSSLEGYNSQNLYVSSPSDKSDQSAAKSDQSSGKSDQSALNKDYGNSVEALEGYFPEDLYPNSERSGQASSEIPNENICSFMQETSVKSDNYEMEDDRDSIIKDEEIPEIHSLEIPVDIYTLPLRPSHKESSFHKKKKKRKEPSATRTVVISGPLSNCSIPVIRHASQNERSEFKEGDSSSQKLTGALSSNGTQRAESCRKKSSHKESPPCWMSSLRNILPFRKKASEKHKEMSHK
ncbi:hypothetical protein Bpfe_003925 [Biomphalaria pfeifferi]|uniref:Uncharacterized protein n=1 Tax=Biomphalaria pfeifferi TaxID=112525 RepID=A0AAD8C596_BIOPF|nr:hypothetical protein Bpfe_003925 [Biomphalaria pfeifferi]